MLLLNLYLGLNKETNALIDRHYLYANVHLHLHWTDNELTLAKTISKPMNSWYYCKLLSPRSCSSFVVCLTLIYRNSSELKEPLTKSMAPTEQIIISVSIYILLLVLIYFKNHEKIEILQYME